MTDEVHACAIAELFVFLPRDAKELGRIEESSHDKSQLVSTELRFVTAVAVSRWGRGAQAPKS